MSVHCLGIPVFFYNDSPELSAINSKSHQFIKKIDEIREMVMSYMQKANMDTNAFFYASIRDDSQNTFHSVEIHPVTEGDPASKCDHCDQMLEKSRIFRIICDNCDKDEDIIDDSSEESSGKIPIIFTLGGLHRLAMHPENGAVKRNALELYSYVFPTGKPNPLKQ